MDEQSFEVNVDNLFCADTLRYCGIDSLGMRFALSERTDGFWIGLLPDDTFTYDEQETFAEVSAGLSSEEKYDLGQELKEAFDELYDGIPIGKLVGVEGDLVYVDLDVVENYPNVELVSEFGEQGLVRSVDRGSEPGAMAEYRFSISEVEPHFGSHDKWLLDKYLDKVQDKNPGRIADDARRSIDDMDDGEEPGQNSILKKR
jgi:hypothetical protein